MLIALFFLSIAILFNRPTLMAFGKSLFIGLTDASSSRKLEFREGVEFIFIGETPAMKAEAGLQAGLDTLVAVHDWRAILARLSQWDSD